MENLVLAVIVWALVFILIPLERIKELWPVALLGIIWSFIVEYTYISLGYYRFLHDFAAIGGVPILQLVFAAGGGILLVNWMRRSPLIKVFLIALFSGLVTLAEAIFVRLGAFEFGRGFNDFLSFVQDLGALSIFTWLVIAILGAETIYGGNKTRSIR